MVELLLSDWRVDLGDQTLTALTATATEKGHSDIVKLLQRLARLKSPLQQTSRLTMPEDFRSRSGSAASASASASASAAKSPRLSSASPSPISQNHPSSIANPSTTSSLLTKQEEDLKTVILKGGDESIETVRRLLLTVNPASDNNAALSVACAAGHLIITRLLLSDIRVDPSDNDNDAIRMAASRGQVEVVRLLLSHPRVDPAACDNAAIRLACAGGYLQVVDLLLSDSRVDPTAESNNAIRVAAEAGNEGIVRRLLADARIDPAAKENYAIVLASFKGHTQVVWLLLSDARVDPAANDNAAIRFAAANGNADVVKLLLGSLRINPTAMKNIATRAACEKGHVKVVEMLLSDALVDPSIELLESLLNIATQNGHSELVKILQRFTKVKATEMKQEGKRRRGSSNSAACESISSPAKKAQQSEVLPVNAVAKVSSIPDNKNSSNNKNAAVALTHGKAVLKEKLDLLDNLEKMRLEKVLEVSTDFERRDGR